VPCPRAEEKAERERIPILGKRIFIPPTNIFFKKSIHRIKKWNKVPQGHPYPSNHK
jgi:hypothetical protein